MTGKSDTYSRTYTASEVAKIVGMNIETLRVWRRRKQLVLEGERQGWTRYTFNDLMAVATYHNMVRSHCTNTIAELIAGTVSQRLANKWSGILGTESSVFCLCNNAMDEENIQIEMHLGLEELLEAITQIMRSSKRQPAYHIVDCGALFLKVLVSCTKVCEESE